MVGGKLRELNLRSRHCCAACRVSNTFIFLVNNNNLVGLFVLLVEVSFFQIQHMVIGGSCGRSEGCVHFQNFSFQTLLFTHHIKSFTSCMEH